MKKNISIKDKNFSTIQNDANILRKDLLTKKSEYDLEILWKQVAEIARAYSGVRKNSKRAEEFRKNFGEKYIPLLHSYELEKFDLLLDSFPKKYRALALKFVQQVIKEYDCKAPSEIALAEIVASAYIRQLRVTSRLYAGIEDDFLNTEKNSFTAILSKELDRAVRTYIIAITTLKHIKNPPIELKVKATTAFIAENQQVNVSNNQNLNKGENNDRQ